MDDDPLAFVPMEVRNASHRELHDVLYTQLGIRVHPGATPLQMFDLLRYKSPAHPLEVSPINTYRDRIMAHIAANTNRLSLPCSGNCYEHSDAMVLQCYLEFSRDVLVERELALIDDI